jgi:glycosyltransferase involved in cell wall biosynthesis
VSAKRFACATPTPLPGDFADTFVVCFVGLFYPWHGVRFLAEAFALVHRHRPDARLLLIGDGEEMPVVRAVLERHGALDATYFAGLVPRADVPPYMAAADVLVSPHADVNRFIGSPIKLFEYMAAGKPIVATRVGQIEEVLHDGESALLVAPEDPMAMAAALERLYDDRKLGDRLGRTAQQEAISRHSWNARLAAILAAGHSDGSETDPR